MITHIIRIAFVFLFICCMDWMLLRCCERKPPFGWKGNLLYSVCLVVGWTLWLL